MLIARFALALALCLPGFIGSTAAAADDAEILAAARAANSAYERRIASMERRLSDESLNAEDRTDAIRNLGRQLDPALVPVLLPYLDADVHPEAVVVATIHAMVYLGAEDAVSQLQRLSTGRYSEAIRVAALNGLHQMAQLGKPDFHRESDAENTHVRATAVTDLGTFRAENAVEKLTLALHDSRDHIRRMAAIGLGKLGERSAGRALTEALTDRDPLVRRYAAEALTVIDYKAAIPSILMAMEANVAGNDMNRALLALSGEDFGFNTHDNLVRRQEAIERAFVWWTANASTLQV